MALGRPIGAQSINLKANISTQIIKKEFTMSNIQQMNLIGFYYHGYVPLHIVSSNGFTVARRSIQSMQFYRIFAGVH